MLAEGLLAALDDIVGAGHPQALLEGAIEVDVLAAGEQGDLLAHAGFARARHADQCDVLLAVGQALRHVQDAPARGDLAGITLDGLRRLGHKHEQTADAGDAATLGFEHESRAGGVVDDIDDALERVEALERAWRVGAVGKHARRGAVDEQRGVGLLCDVVVVDLARASHGHHDRAQVAQHHACRGAGAAGGSENEDLLAGNLHTQLLDQALETEVVGVVAAQTAIGQTRDRVDVAHAFGERAQLVQVVHDGALVGNGHVGALPLVARYKGRKVLGLALKTHVLKPREFLVDGRGVAVAQHAAQHAIGAGCGDVSHLEHLRVAAKVGEALAHVVNRVEQVVEGLAAKGAVQIEVEHKLKVVPGDGAALELDKVDVERIEALEHAIEGARFVGRGDHERGTVGAGVDARLAADDDEACVVVVRVLNVGLQHLQAVERRATARGDGGDVGALGVGDHLGRHSRVEILGGVQAVCLDKASALRDGLTVAVDLMHALEPGARFDEQVVIDLEAQRAHDVEVELREQVVDRVNRAGSGVFDGQYAKLAEAVSHGAHDAFEGLEERDIGHVEELARGDLAVGALYALACDAGSLGEGHVEGLGSGVGLLRDRDALELVDIALLLGLAHAHEETEQRDGLRLVALGRATGKVVELGALTGGVEDGLAHLDF